MPKLSKADRAALEQQLADDDAAEDDDFEFELTEGDRSVRIPWSRRESLGELGFKVPKAAPPKAPAGQGGGGGKVSVFGPRNARTGGSQGSS